MYYINFIFLYSFLGFVLESVVFKVYNTNCHSGIFLGPYNFTYGFGMLICYLIFNRLPLPNNFLSYIIYYLIFVFITSLIELLMGHLIYFFLKIDKWDYSNHKYHFGKYLCLTNSLIWGILVLLFINLIHPYLNSNILLTIPHVATYLITTIFLIDFCYLIFKIFK